MKAKFNYKYKTQHRYSHCLGNVRARVLFLCDVNLQQNKLPDIISIVNKLLVTRTHFQ